MLDYAQLERAVRLSTGKLVKTPKDQLMHEPGLGRGRVTNLSIPGVRMRTMKISSPSSSSSWT
ncbi:hypothetical protein GS416_11885 [Rhodococcus hoagii]|nr:hypothetical protein [Prescottella equi]